MLQFLALQLLMAITLDVGQSWSTTVPCRSALQFASSKSARYSTTPFEADFYGDDDVVNPFLEDVSPIAVPSDTKLVIGLNKYTHDTSLCAADARTGNVLFGLAKERLGERQKNRAGNVAILVEKCLECLDLDLDAVERVVVNNHHHRVLPLEEDLDHMRWESELNLNGGDESGYDEDENLLPNAQHSEVSHHLAHAYSTAAQAPFDSGLIVVMDGMGETYRTMIDGREDERYTSDFDLSNSIQTMPSNMDVCAAKTRFDWREAESIYTFTKSTERIDIKPLFKRFQQERTPPTPFNHGFENMDSIGAVYSRASSHIFGDWNACGKVMGLAPWRVYSWENGDLRPAQGEPHAQGVWEEGFQIDRSLLKVCH
jgi:predicted NodU family carbamoyl transferase